MPRATVDVEKLKREAVERHAKRLAKVKRDKALALEEERREREAKAKTAVEKKRSSEAKARSKQRKRVAMARKVEQSLRAKFISGGAIESNRRRH
jgi:hypothetical protein